MPDESKIRKEPIRTVNIKRVDTKEFELPETLFISDIDTKVFQGIVLQCLSQIEGISLVEGSFIDNILGRAGPELGAGIYPEQDSKTHSVSFKIEINIGYGVSIPAKAEEIQTKIVEEVTRLTGLRVSSVHVLFKNIIPSDQTQTMLRHLEQILPPKQQEHDEYSDNF